MNPAVFVNKPYILAYMRCLRNALASLRLKPLRPLPRMTILDFQAQGIRHKAQGKWHLPWEFPCALSLTP